MQHFCQHISWRANSTGAIALAACALLCPLPLMAQEADYPSNAETHPGEIVYSRDVPYGMATRRFSQGEASTVVPDQSPLIIDSVLTGLQPLSDLEQAAITAPLTSSLQIGRDAIDTGLSVLTGPQGNADFTRSESAGSATGNIIGDSLSVLPSALASIGRATGGDK